MNTRRQVNKREDDAGHRTPRDGEYDAIVTATCDECRDPYRPYRRGQRFCGRECAIKANNRSARAAGYRVVYNRAWREKVKRERPQDWQAYLAHERARKRRQRIERRKANQ